MILILTVNMPASVRMFSMVWLLLAACSSPPTRPSESEQRGKVLAQSARCIEAEFVRFTERTSALVASFDADDPEAARVAFAGAMTQWELLEALQVGPAALALLPGGEGLRDTVYAWPLVTRCALEEALVAKSWEAGIETLLVNRKTLAALDYLLFETGTQTACAEDASIVASGAWAALSAEELAARRRAFAQAVSTDVHARAVALTARWKDGFTTTLAEPGSNNRVFMSQRTALNSLSDALFYLDGPVKDVKLAAPLGLAAGSCQNPPCAELLEFQHAELNTVALRANLAGFARLFHGCEEGVKGQGFDSLLVAVNATELEAHMSADLATLRASLEAAPELRTALQAEPATARRIYDEVKGVTDLLKTEFITVLDLEIPTSLEGDND